MLEQVALDNTTTIELCPQNGGKTAENAIVSAQDITTHARSSIYYYHIHPCIIISSASITYNKYF